MRPVIYREQAMKIIENFYPTDADHPRTRKVGRELLQLARDDVLGSNWRNEPTEVLLRYAELCQENEAQIKP